MVDSQELKGSQTNEQKICCLETSQQNVEDNPLRNKPNIAIRTTHYLPITELGVHILAIAVSSVILMLSIRNVYFADLTRPNLSLLLNAFQFVARFHEFLLVLSVGYIVSYHLKYELVQANGLSFGLLASGFQLSAPKFLISRSFWTASRGKANRRRTSVIAALLGLAAAFTLLSGPLSAILVVPQAGWWQITDPFSGTGGQTFLAGSHDDLFPPSINASSATGTCDTVSCWMLTLSDWTADWVNNRGAPNLTVRQTIGSTRYLSSSTPKNRTTGYAVASTAMGDLTRNLANLWGFSQRHDMNMASSGRPSITMSLKGDNGLMKPLIQVQCSDPYDITNLTHVDVTFPSDELIRDPGEEKYPGGTKISIDTAPWKKKVDVQFNWTEVPLTGSQPLLGALIGMSFLSPERAPFFQNSTSKLVRGLMACTMDSRWAPTTMSFDPRADNIVILSDSDPASIVMSADKMRATQKLRIDLSYLNQINAALTDTERPFTVVEFILKWFYVVDGYFDAYWSTQWPWMVATTLSLHVTDVLARISTAHNAAIIFYQDPSGGTKDAFTTDLANMNLLSAKYRLEGQEAIDFVESARTNPDQFTEVTWTIQHFGYAWSFRTATVFVAAAVVLLHMIMVIAHITIAINRRWECRSWSTLIELVTLLLQSPRSTLLEGTSTGITDTNTYSLRVKIREDEDGNSAIVRTETSTGMLDSQDVKLRPDKPYY
jgi:hypothetical protein